MSQFEVDLMGQDQESITILLEPHMLEDVIVTASKDSKPVNEFANRKFQAYFNGGCFNGH